jgi:hypothetical protein
MIVKWETQDFYIYPEELLSFEKSLQQFPKTSKDEVRLEYGADPNYYCHFQLRVCVLDSAGHSALELKTNNRQAPPATSESHFYLQCEPATINKLGAELCSWIANMDTPLSFEWKNT